MRIAFFGTPSLCLPYLDKLCKEGLVPSLVITNPDRPVGRKQVVSISPVAQWAKKHDIHVLQPEVLDNEFLSAYQKHGIDLAIVIAYGKILTQQVIDMPRYGTWNVHYSLLPRWRGASPVEASILAGDTETGVCIQKMVRLLDAGPIIMSQRFSLNDSHFAEEIKHELSLLGADLLIQAIDKLRNEGEVLAQEQDIAKVTTCKKITRSDGQVFLDDMSDMDLWRRFRAYHPWPGIFFFDKQGKRVKITSASFINNIFVIEKVLPEGKKEMLFHKKDE